MKILAILLSSCLFVVNPVFADTTIPCTEKHLSNEKYNSIQVGMAINEVMKMFGCSPYSYDKPYPNNPTTAAYIWGYTTRDGLGYPHTTYITVHFDTRTATVKEPNSRISGFFKERAGV